MGIEAKIICDSVNCRGDRLTTFVLRYHRFILAEVNTHRMLSRSTSSSRAIPVDKIIQQVLDDPAIPVYFGAEQKGMQAGEELTPYQVELAKGVWLGARDAAVEKAYTMKQLGVHKSIVNRLLEPYMWCSTVLTATEFANFFTLRVHPTAQPEFRVLAEKMADAYNRSIIAELDWGQWHLPFVTGEEKSKFSEMDLVKFSTARSARVSYLLHDGTNPTPEKDIALHDRLVVEKPAHASPAEHPAMASKVCCVKPEGNLRGFLQYRKMLVNEHVSTFPWEEQG